MKSKADILIMITRVGVIMAVYLILMTFKTNRTFNDYEVSDVPYTYIEGDSIYLYWEVDYEEEKIAIAAAKAGFVGGINKYTIDTIGEMEIPNIVTENNLDYWYTITTSDGEHFCVIINDEIVID